MKIGGTIIFLQLISRNKHRPVRGLLVFLIINAQNRGRKQKNKIAKGAVDLSKSHVPAYRLISQFDSLKSSHFSGLIKILQNSK